MFDARLKIEYLHCASANTGNFDDDLHFFLSLFHFYSRPIISISAILFTLFGPYLNLLQGTACAAHKQELAREFNRNCWNSCIFFQ